MIVIKIGFRLFPKLPKGIRPKQGLLNVVSQGIVQQSKGVLEGAQMPSLEKERTRKKAAKAPCLTKGTPGKTSENGSHREVHKEKD